LVRYRGLVVSLDSDDEASNILK